MKIPNYESEKISTQLHNLSLIIRSFERRLEKVESLEANHHAIKGRISEIYPQIVEILNRIEDLEEGDLHDDFVKLATQVANHELKLHNLENKPVDPLPENKISVYHFLSCRIEKDGHDYTLHTRRVFGGECLTGFSRETLLNYLKEIL